MKIHIVIPAHNEEDSIALTLESLATQTLLPKQIVVVNDNSSDNTQSIIEKFTAKYNFISLVNTTSSNKHLPGRKIINAFYKGYETLDDDHDVICKFDADLIFPNNYLEEIANHFKEDSKIGMAAGFCYIQKNNNWVLENLTGKDHIRGALKAYRKNCFLQIGKLKNAMGWDTVDEFLAQYYYWKIKTIDSLHVKHLKPTGVSYSPASKHLQGEALYKMRFGFGIAFLSAAKLAYKKNSFKLFKDYLSGYFNAKREKAAFLITEEQGEFVRKLRWKSIFKKIGLK